MKKNYIAPETKVYHINVNSPMLIAASLENSVPGGGNDNNFVIEEDPILNNNLWDLINKI